MRPSEPKTTDQIRSEWDAIAGLRNSQITNGTDISYNQVLKPAVVGLLPSADVSRALDVGCGTGQTTATLAQLVGRVTAIDLSEESVRIARENTRQFNNVEILVTSLEDFATMHHNEFTLAVANMSLSVMPGLADVLGSIQKLLATGGHIVAIVPHPCFWPAYWGYEAAGWFDYASEISIEADFRISRERTALRTTHVHRPVSTYFNELARCGFAVELVQELMPAENLSNSRDLRRVPRFMGLRARKTV